MRRRHILRPYGKARGAALVATLVLATGCGDCGATGFEPCDVSVHGTSASQLRERGLSALEEGHYELPGPHHVWTTAPADACASNPRTAARSRFPDAEILVTYPSRSDPAASLDGAVARGKWPLVIFAHANEDTEAGDGSCLEIFDRYRYLHARWASWGYVVASIDESRTNCEPPSRKNIIERSDGMLAALERLRELDADPESRFGGRLDLSRIVLAGHSRGGGAALHTATRLEEVEGIVLLQSIDLSSFGLGAPSLDAPAFGVTAGRDTDLDFPYTEPNEALFDGPHSWVTIEGGLHAWSGDNLPLRAEDEPGITRAEQLATTAYFTSAFLVHHIGASDGGPTLERPGARRALYSHDGARHVRDEIGGAGVYLRWDRDLPDTRWIDRFDGALEGDDAGTNLTGGANRCEDLVRCEEVFTYRPDSESPGVTYRKESALLLEADAEGGTFRVELTGDDGDSIALGPDDRLEARVRGLRDAPVAAVDIEVVTEEGTSRVALEEHIGPEPLSERYTQLVVDGRSLNVDAPRRLTDIVWVVRGGSIEIDDLRIVARSGLTEPIDSR